MPLVSVIMSTYREPKTYLRQAVESILSQTVTDLEFRIVLDDPHNAEARQLLAEYAAADARIILLPNECNVGLVASLNRALYDVRSPFIARMDADDIAEPTRLERQLAYLRQETLDIVGAQTVRIDEQGTVVSGPPARADSPAAVMGALRVAPCVPHPTWLVRRDVYVTLHGYRDIPRCEDYDLLLRALRHGYRIGVCPETLLRYRLVQSSISRSALLAQHLTSRYLAEQYPNEATPDAVRRITARVTDAQNTRYRRAEQLLYEAIRQRGIRRGGYLLASLVASRYQPRRFYDLWRVRLARRKGERGGARIGDHADV